MKKAIVLVLGLICSSMCYGEGEGKPLFTFDDARAQSVAKEAISRKYPEIQVEDLSYAGWSVESKTNGPAVIIMQYEIGTPETGVGNTAEGGTVKKSKRNTIAVLLTEDGRVRYVGKSESTITLKSKEKQEAPGQPGTSPLPLAPQTGVSAGER